MIKKIKNWTIDKWRRFKKWIIVGILGIGTVMAAPLIIDNPPEEIPEHLKLKAPKDKILFNREIDWLECNELGDECFNRGKIIKYLYASDIEVPSTIHKGLQEDISKRTSNAQFFKKEVFGAENGEIKERWIGRFYAGEPFYQEGDKWYQTETATTTIEIFEKQTKVGWLDNLLGRQALAVTTTTYSGAGDGWITDSQSVGGGSRQTQWDTVHDNTTGSTAYPVASYARVAVIESGSGTGRTIYIRRAFFPIDTSALPNNAVISSSTLDLWSNLVDEDWYEAESYISTIQTDQPDPTTLTTADYNNCGATDNPSKGTNDIDVADLDTIQYHTFTFNATGKEWISLTGWTMLGQRQGHDIEDALPGSSPATRYSYSKWYSSENTGTDKDPLLTVEYTLAPPAVEEIRDPGIRFFD